MGTKTNPGRFDCLAKARDDEEMFPLLDRDPLAPYLVSIWAWVRHGNQDAARRQFDEMLEKVGMRYVFRPEIEKAGEALDISMKMFRAQEERARLAAVLSGRLKEGP